MQCVVHLNDTNFFFFLVLRNEKQKSNLHYQAHAVVL